MFKQGNGPSQRCQVVFGHACKIQHWLRSLSACARALGGGLVQGRGVDPAERGFRHFVNPEGDEPRGGHAKPHGTMGLLLNKPQCSYKTFRFARELESNAA
jgi:hypothetical protein